jgi:hypothetical protein
MARIPVNQRGPSTTGSATTDNRSEELMNFKTLCARHILEAGD